MSEHHSGRTAVELPVATVTLSEETDAEAELAV